MNNDSRFSALSEALASVNFNTKVESEYRLKYNTETGEYRTEDACTVPVEEVWDEDYVVLPYGAPLRSPVDHRVIDGKITWIDTSISTFWDETPEADILENNPYFCIKEINDGTESR
jgi:hypothetical protein